MPRLLARVVAAIAILGTPACSRSSAPALTEVEQLGKSIFFDRRLSLRGNQSCASCHAPQVGWTGDLSHVNAASAVYEGSVTGLFSNRKPPAAAYAMAPVLHRVAEDGDTLVVGGSFWDGRATGERLGDPLADQAQGPFLNPVEQALPDSACVVRLVCEGSYADALDEQAPGSCDITWPSDAESTCRRPVATLPLGDQDRARADRTYDAIAKAVAAYERSREVNPFSSKFDRYLAGAAALTAQEKAGLDLFVGRAKCADCHVLDKGAHGEPPMLTDFTYDNIGTPRNPENPWYRDLERNPDGPRWRDNGLGAFLARQPAWRDLADANMGKHKVPTVRNVDKRPDASFVKAYMHNGYFKTLRGLVHFYNTRDVKPACDGDLPEREALARNCWPPPEVTDNLNTDELGNLGLSEAEENAIVAFMQALSDGYAADRQGIQ